MSRSSALLLAALVAFPATAAQRELVDTRTFTPADGSAVILDVGDINVDVRAADVHELSIAAALKIAGVSEERAESWIESAAPSYSEDEHGVRVTARPAPGGFLGIGLLFAHARLEVVSPPALVPDVTTTRGDIRIRGDFPGADPLRLRTASGDMELEGAATSVDIRTTGGDARLELVRPLERLFARSASGGVTLRGGAKSVEADTSSGDFWMMNLSGPVNVVSDTGRITLGWDRLDPDATVVVTSSSGRVRLILPPGCSPRGTIRTTSGTIRSDLPGTVNEAGDTITLAGDGPMLSVESTTGEVVVTVGALWK